MQYLSWMWKRLRIVWVDVEAVLEIMETDSTIQEAHNPVGLFVQKASVEFRNVTFKYGDQNIMEDVSFKVEGG